MEGDHGKKLLRSSGAAAASQVWRYGVAFATQVVLRYVLPEEDWGLFSWSANFLFVLLAQVRDLGLPAQVVRDRRQPYGAFLVVELVWGLALCGLVYAASPLLAQTNTEPHPSVLPVLKILVIFLFVEGLGKIPLTYLEAELLIDRALMPEVVRNVCFAATSIYLAIAGYGVFSLIVAHVVSAGVFTVLVWWRAWGEMPLTWTPGEMGPLVRRSLPLMLMALVLLALDLVDYQILTARYSQKLIGLYSGALYLALLVNRMLEWPLRRALYPSFVAVRNDARRFFETYRLATILLMCCHVVVAGLLFVNAETLLTWYGGAGRNYASVADVLRLLCLVPLIQPFTRCAEDVLLPRNEEGILIIASVLNLASLVGLGIVLSRAFGLEGMALAKLLPVGSLVLSWAIWRVDRQGFWRLLRHLAAIYGVAAVLFGPLWMIDDDGLRFFVSVAAAALALLIYARVYHRAFRQFFRPSA